jgi:AraC-like DNA-binding protein
MIDVLLGSGAGSSDISSVTSIGLAVGFFDQSHFTKRFRKFTGMTPLAYRKRFR